jgi:hypothetical protein
VILDDLGKEQAKYITTHLKLWGDPWYNQPGEIKGGQVALTYDTMIVTSNFSPDELFEEPDLSAIRRRFQVVHFE